MTNTVDLRSQRTSAIWTVSDSEYKTVVLCELNEFLPGGRVPNTRRSVVTAGGKSGAVRAKSD